VNVTVKTKRVQRYRRWLRLRFYCIRLQFGRHDHSTT